MAFEKATRKKVKLRAAFIGPSGSGKTITALQLANAIVDRYGGEIGDYIEQCKLHCPDLSRPLFEDCEAMPMQRESYLQKSLIERGVRASAIWATRVS